MKESIMGFLSSVKEWWGNLSKKMRIVLLASIAGVLILILAIVLVLNKKTYVPLYNNLSNTDAAGVLAELGNMGVLYDVGQNGNIYVLDKDVNRVRMQMAVAGLPGSTLDYEPLKNGMGITSTQAQQSVWQVVQLQERAQDSIKTFNEVEMAIVTISMPPNSGFAWESNPIPPTASIKITKKPGQKLSPEQISGILHIVRNSVPGLVDDNISLSDETGDIKGEVSGDNFANSQKMSLTEEMNAQIRSRINSVIEPIYGRDKVKVAVSTTLDTDKRETEQVTYVPLDPENPTNNPLDYYEGAKDKAGAAADPAAGVPGAQDNVGVPQYNAEDPDLAAADSYSTRDAYDYLVSSVKNKITKDGTEIKNVTAAIVIDAATLPEGERDQIIDLVSGASGIAPENIKVQNLTFSSKALEPLAVQNDQLQRVLIISGIALLALCILFVVIIMSIVGKNKKARLAAEQGALEQYDEDGTLLVNISEEEEFEPITMLETPEQKLKAQIKDLAKTDPEIVAQLIKTWLVQA